MADSLGNLSGFPGLIIAPDEINGLWNRFMTEFDIMVRVEDT